MTFTAIRPFFGLSNAREVPPGSPAGVGDHRLRTGIACAGDRSDVRSQSHSAPPLFFVVRGPRIASGTSIGQARAAMYKSVRQNLSACRYRAGGTKAWPDLFEQILLLADARRHFGGAGACGMSVFDSLTGRSRAGSMPRCATCLTASKRSSKRACCSPSTCN